MRIVGADIGKENTKIITKINGMEKQFFMKTKVEAYNGESLLDKDTHTLVYKNNEYLVGSGASVNNFDISKNNDHHIISLLTGLALSVGGVESIGLCAGMPISLFYNKGERDAFRESLLLDEVVILDNKVIRVKVDKVALLPETIGIIYKNPSYYKNVLVGVIDIGGLNTNGAIYQNGKPIKSSTFTINEGGNILENKIKKELNSELGLNYQSYEIPFILKSGVKINGKVSIEGNKIVEDIRSRHIENIVQEMKKNNWNIDSIDLMFTGGGSLLLQDDIMRRLENSIISASALWDNARAFYLGGEVLCLK